MFLNLVISGYNFGNTGLIGHEYDVGVTVAPVVGVAYSTVQAPSVGC